MLPTLLTTMLFTMGSGAVPYAILSPPFHLKTDLSGLTILVCVVHDIHQGELEVAWISSGTRGINPAVSNLLQGHSGIQNTMSVISVPSNEWMSYTCFVSHRASDQLVHRHYAGFPMETIEMADDEEKLDTCLEHQSYFFEDVRTNSDLLLVQALRILLLKITIFDVLMTVQAVIKW
ncbi:hypothetical protein QQF64_027514 [Cirrhinus molitorella]|uniref:Ig-like domain-containing protein n=1 Tax=Cirrhinus molitorella TaxID=172907 RepID=A0ABR3NCL7_9TELE